MNKNAAIGWRAFHPLWLVIVALPLAFLSFALASAQEAPPPDAPADAQAQLDQLLAPVALYPDALLSQILMASTYPQDVALAGNWLLENNNGSLTGADLAAALDQQSWDPSVKSLVPFPQVLQMMNNNLQWTEQLGEAFLANQGAVMDSVQRLRQQAQAAGTLQSTSQQTVSEDGSNVVIAPAQGDAVSVPYYNPAVAYGEWPYAAYPPYTFPAPPGVVYYDSIFSFWPAVVVVGPLWGWAHWDWAHHNIRIDDYRFRAINQGRPPRASGVWRHDPVHRTVPYQTAAVRNQYRQTPPEVQRSYRGYEVQQERAAPRPVVSYGIQPAYAPRSAPPVFESYSRGAEVRSQAARGSSSRAAAAPRGNSARGGRGGGERRTR